ncbi:MAG: hypothetical protein H5T41_11240 [Methanomassiliicoccales archaeon]|nr:hypothetical protein [Methanomassiliicoccales archaeon]
MKWVPMVEKANRRAVKVLGVRGLYVLFTILTVLLLSGAYGKWGGP